MSFNEDIFSRAVQWDLALLHLLECCRAERPPMSYRFRKLQL